MDGVNVTSVMLMQDLVDASPFKTSLLSLSFLSLLLSLPLLLLCVFPFLFPFLPQFWVLSELAETGSLMNDD